MEYSKALDTAVSILKCNLSEFNYQFKASNSTNNFYQLSGNTEWTTGFCTGQYWLAYEHTGGMEFQKAALAQVKSFLKRAENRVDVDHHDMGFLYTPSCVAAYRLTGDETGKKAALLAADILMGRFIENGQFFQAWGGLGAPENSRLIIDCLLNLPLLYWASDITGDPSYRERALAHTETSLSHLLRVDYSTYHTFFFDTETGEPLRGVTHQGYKDNSAWARGQAWGIYGLALSMKYTRETTCINMFYHVADFYLKHLPEDLIPFWDLCFTEADGEPKDSSAAAIAACGMLEMAKYLPQEKAQYYTGYAKKTAAALINSCAVQNVMDSNGLLLHGVYAKKSPYNTVIDRGVDECNLWGDYFYLELLTRLVKDWPIYW
ncbi:MAG: glycoside hydrolase family 88 protein [Clostridiales bacterium]|nr:glycoside hydrolase family 88 protein [Clostridiales bacterium]